MWGFLAGIMKEVCVSCVCVSVSVCVCVCVCVCVEENSQTLKQMVSRQT